MIQTVKGFGIVKKAEPDSHPQIQPSKGEVPPQPGPDPRPAQAATTASTSRDRPVSATLPPRLGPIPEGACRPEPGPTPPRRGHRLANFRLSWSCTPMSTSESHLAPSTHPVPPPGPQLPRGPKGTAASSHTSLRCAPRSKRALHTAREPAAAAKAQRGQREALFMQESRSGFTPAHRQQARRLLTKHTRPGSLPVPTPEGTGSRNSPSAPFLTPVSPLSNLHICSAVQKPPSKTVAPCIFSKHPVPPRP